MYKPFQTLFIALTLGAGTLFLAACERGAQEGVSDDATIKYEAAVENEEAAATPGNADENY